MRIHTLFAVALTGIAGIALAQVQASSSIYLLDVDSARYSGPAGQRLALRLGDVPRHITIGAQEEICVQLRRDESNAGVISARVRSLGAEQAVADVRLVAPDISPGTFRSTPWGLLLRVLPEQGESEGIIKAVGTEQAPVCTL